MNVKKYAWKSIVALLILLALIPRIAIADETQCKSVLTKCDQAVQDLQKENAIQKQIISDEEMRFNTEHKELETEEIWKPLCIGGFTIVIVESAFLLLKH